MADGHDQELRKLRIATIEQAGAEFAKRIVEGKMDYETAHTLFKRQVVEAALAESKGCKVAAGRILKISRNYVRTLARLVNK